MEVVHTNERDLGGEGILQESGRDPDWPSAARN